MDSFEEMITALAGAGELALELVGIAVVLWGGAAVVLRALRGLAARRPVRFTALRLDFARYLALGLEFQLGADIIGTAIAPSWEQIGRLGAIAVIRTALNYFLGMEMREERATLSGEAVVATTDEGSDEEPPAASAVPELAKSSTPTRVG
jgi:uncharacterized membrane protein